MPVSEPLRRYTRTAMALHWIVALAVVGQFTLGWWMLGIAKDPPGARANAFNLHKSIGLSVLALLLVRLAWRATHRPPPLPPMPAWQAWAARANHGLLYGVLLVQVGTGYIGSAVSGYPVRFFGLVLPSWAPKNVPLKDFLSSAHYVGAWVVAGVVGVHLLAVLKHQFVDRDRLLRRMWDWPAAAGRPPDPRG
jgi:cytochrome b561